MTNELSVGRQGRIAANLLAAICAGVGLFFAPPHAVAAAPETVAAPIRADKVIMINVTKIGKRILALGERGVVLLSDDDGSTWKAVRTPVTRTLTAAAFADDRQGVAVGHGGSILRTEDAGLSWKRVEVPEIGHDSVLGVSYLGAERFIAFGAFGLYIVSTDGGKSWTRKAVIDADFDRHIMAALPVGETLFLAAESGNLARSGNRGETWDRLRSPYIGSFFGAVATADGTLIAFGMRGNVWRSTDKGSTWAKVDMGNTIGINGGQVLADGTVVLVGNNGLVAHSKDNGQSFKVSFSPKGAGFGGVVTNAKGELVVAGEDGVGIVESKLWN